MDPGFKLLLGRLFDKVRKEYPVLVNLPSSQVPEEITAHIVRHQLRAKPDGWPLLQIGPGILTANDTTGYSWETFRPRLSSAIAALFDAYPKDLFPLKPQTMVLRYLNAVPFDISTAPILPFLRDKLHTGIVLDAGLGETVKDLDQPRTFALQVGLPMKEPAGLCTLSFQTGGTVAGPALVWQFEAIARDEEVPTDPDAISAWLDKAHDVIEAWFERLAAGDLMKTFKGEA